MLKWGNSSGSPRCAVRSSNAATVPARQAGPGSDLRPRMHTRTTTPWVVVDTETGGLDPHRHAILTVGVVLLDTSTGEMAGLELAVNDPEGDACEEALRKNHLDPVRIRRTGLAPKEAVTRIEDFTAPHIPPDKPVILAGHNVAFDVAFLRRLYRLADAEHRFTARYSHRTVDLHSAYVLLAEAGLVPQLPVASLGAIALSLEVPHDPARRHTALGDALTTARCLFALLRRIRTP